MVRTWRPISTRSPLEMDGWGVAKVRGIFAGNAQWESSSITSISLSFLPLTVSNSLYHFSTDSQTFSIISLQNSPSFLYHSFLLFRYYSPPLSTTDETRTTFSLSWPFLDTCSSGKFSYAYQVHRFRERAFVTLFKRVPWYISRRFWPKINSAFLALNLSCTNSVEESTKIKEIFKFGAFEARSSYEHMVWPCSLHPNFIWMCRIWNGN